MERKKLYQMPLIDEWEVSIEQGIATSPFGIEDNIIIGMEEGGDDWGVYE